MRELPTYVYVIAEAGTQFLKIGVARNPNTRILELQTGNPRKLSLEFYQAVPTKRRAQQVEYRAHGSLMKWRAVGEWFECPIIEAVYAVQAACNFVHNYRTKLHPTSDLHRTRHLGFDYRAFLEEELAAEAEEVYGPHPHH